MSVTFTKEEVINQTRLQTIKDANAKFIATIDGKERTYRFTNGDNLMRVSLDGRFLEPLPFFDEEMIRAGKIDVVVVETSPKLKSSGEVREFSTGAVRDSGNGKPRLGLLPQDLLARVAILYGLGADKYGKDNWRLGQPQDAVEDSLLRHLLAYKRGRRDEDHLAAVVWNALSLLNVDEYMKDNPEVFNIFGTYPDPEPHKSLTTIYADGKLFAAIEEEEE